jgi:excisionase family DNA binding protein
MNAPKFYTVDETAEILKVAPETVRRLLRSGRLRGVKVGRSWRIPERAIEDFAGLPSTDTITSDGSA